VKAACCAFCWAVCAILSEIVAIVLEIGFMYSWELSANYGRFLLKTECWWASSCDVITDSSSITFKVCFFNEFVCFWIKGSECFSDFVSKMSFFSVFIDLFTVDFEI
jgi:hypothetical protein